MQLKGRATTKPGSLLKSKIPVRRGTEWDDASLGFVEVDTVAHCGPSGKGEFCYTPDATDVSSGWTELVAVRNKAETHMLEAMKSIRGRLPFALKGIDSDNGSGFINWHFMRYCEAEDLVFTRSRPYAKNDGCFVEEKNWSVARRVVGYGRYEGQAACDLLNEIYERQRILTNYFMPSAKDKGWLAGCPLPRQSHDPVAAYNGHEGCRQGCPRPHAGRVQSRRSTEAAHGDKGAHAGAPEDDGIAVTREGGAVRFGNIES